MVKNVTSPKENSAGNICISSSCSSRTKVFAMVFQSHLFIQESHDLKHQIPPSLLRFPEDQFERPWLCILFHGMESGSRIMWKHTFRWGSVNYNSSESHTLEDLEVRIGLIHYTILYYMFICCHCVRRCPPSNCNFWGIPHFWLTLGPPLDLIFNDFGVFVLGM